MQYSDLFEQPEILDAKSVSSAIEVLAESGSQLTCLSSLNWTSDDHRSKTLLELTTMIYNVQEQYPTFSAPFQYVILESSWETNISVLSDENLAIAQEVWVFRDKFS